jgi:hypothetical protein
MALLPVAVGLGGYGKKVDPSLAEKRVEAGYIARQIKVTSPVSPPLSFSLMLLLFLLDLES